jgi:hypothetical protein
MASAGGEMSFRPDHEIYRRRFGRNLGLGLTLAAFVALVFGLTVVKVTRTGEMIAAEKAQSAAGATAP